MPVPVNFYFGQARFTPAGEKAVEELAEAVKQQTSKPSLLSATPIRAAIVSTMSNCPSGGRPQRATICSPTA